MALRVAGDPDRVELRAARAHRREQLGGAGELAGRLGGVAGEHEQLAHAAGEQAVEQLPEVRPVAHQPRRQVRDGRVAGAREPLRQVEGRAEALARRCRDGQLDVSAQVGEHLLFCALERQHLEARAAQELGQARRPGVRAG
jgi:hypothetical protein